MIFLIISRGAARKQKEICIIFKYVSAPSIGLLRPSDRNCPVRPIYSDSICVLRYLCPSLHPGWAPYHPAWSSLYSSLMVVVRGQHYKGICFITPDTAQSKSGSGNVLSRSALMISQALYCFVTLMFSGKIIILQALCLVTEFNLLKNTFEFLGEKYYYCQNSDNCRILYCKIIFYGWLTLEAKVYFHIFSNIVR